MVQNDKSRMYSGSFRNGKMVYGRLAPGEENSGKLVNMVREKARQVANDNELEIIIIDGPPGIGCPVISTITGVDKVVIVTEPTISGLHDMQRTIEVVRKFGIQAYVIINKFDLNTEISFRIDKWCSSEAIAIAGHLPFDPEMVEAMVKGLSIIELDSNSSTSRKIKEIWNKILNKN
jgi:MinD superfamily P-loop ATPase